MKLALYPLVQQFQYRNGTNLVAGKIYVYYRGRTRLATIYKDQNGTIAQNPLTCDADGRAPCFVDSNYQYTIVVCDARGKELFSQDLDADNAININDALSGDSKLYIINSDGTISVNATSGDSWIEYDLGTFNKPLGVTEPLYWEKDDEEASIIGLHTDGLVSGVSADLTELSGKVNELSATKMDKSQSAEFYPSNNPSGFIADADLSVYAKKEELTAYQSAGDYYSASNPSGFINSDAISDMATTGFVAEVSADITAMIPTALTGDYLTKESADTLYQPIGDYVNQNELSNVSADITAMIPTALTGDYLDKASADKLYYGIDNPSGFITGVDLTPYQTVTGMTAYQTAGEYYSASNPSGFITNDAITGLQPSGDYATNTQLCAVSSTITGMIPSGEYELCAGNGIELVDDPNAKTTTISVTAQGGNPEVEQVVVDNSATWNTVTDKLDTTALIPTVDSNTISYSGKPTDKPIYASGNDLKNVDSIQGKTNLAIIPSGVLQVPEVITAAPNGVLNVPGVIISNPGGLTANGLSANTNGLFANGLSADANRLYANGLSAAANYGLTANGLTADAHNSGFSANGITAGINSNLTIKGKSELLSSMDGKGFILSSVNSGIGSAVLTLANSDIVSPKFEAKNISGAGFSIEASGAKGYDESGNVVWDTNNPQVKNIISYSDTKTAVGGLNGNIILTTQPSTNASNLTSSPYVIMDADQASYFAAYGPSAQTPTVKMAPDAITFSLQAGNTGKTTVGYNDVKQELSGSSWTLTGSIQKRELEYDANTSAITAIAGSAIGGGGGGSALPISAGHGIKFEIVNDTLVASVTSTSTSGYVWQSASLFHTDTPIKQTTYTLSDNCSNYDRLDVDFYDINNWRTVMECPIPSNLDASGTRGGYFSVVPESTATGAKIWFKAFNWTAAGTTWSCYCSELAGQGGSTTQTINANQPDNPPKVVNIIGWKRVGGN